MHPDRSARSHLRTIAATYNFKTSRVSEVIEVSGLAGAATNRVGVCSRGMSQRLGIAAALLADPMTLILDEPVNGLDPEGVQWVRRLVCDLATRGRTVFLSSHLMSEMSQTADQLLVVGAVTSSPPAWSNSSPTPSPAALVASAPREPGSSPALWPPTV